MSNSLVDLSQFITRHYNLEEIRTLCFSLKIDFEELGEGGKTTKVQNFLLLVGRENRIDDLIFELNKTRPKSFAQSKLSANPNFIADIYQQLPSFVDVEIRPREESLLIKKVNSFWVEGVLENSLHNTALIELGMDFRPEAIDYPWQMIVQPFQQEPYTLPSGKSIEEVFDEANQSLLILGDPGSGKTTMLLTLAQELLTKAEYNPSFPIPVVFNLSTWSIKDSLADWLINELNEKYLVPKRIGQDWIENNKILLLLDGLDEVQTEYQSKCVEKINHFRQEHLVSLAVCSRIQEYQALNSKLKLECAISLNQLSYKQIDEFIISGGDKLKSLGRLFNQDKVFKDLARTPLLLGIMSLAYQDTPIKIQTTFNTETIEFRRTHLFNTYVERMFERRSQHKKVFTKDLVTERLSWIARRMNSHNQSIFLVERIQPSWLSNHFWQILYVFNSRLIIGLFVGLGLGFLSYAFNNEFVTGSLINFLQLYISGGLISGFILFLAVILRFEIGDKINKFKKEIFTQFALVDGFFVGAIVFLILVPYYSTLRDIFFFSLFFGSVFALCFGLIAALRSKNSHWSNDIQTIETFSWSWNKAIKWGGIGFILGSFCIWILVLVGSWVSGRTNSDPYYILTLIRLFGVGLGVSTALYGGLQTTILDINSTTNEDMSFSLKNLGVIGLSFGFVVFLFVGISQILVNFYYNGFVGWDFNVLWKRSASFGIGLGLLACLWYGGLDVIQHYTLRFLLWVRGDLPINFNRFLNFSTDRIFLRDIGHGYIYIHRMLMEHFAAIKIKSDKISNIPIRKIAFISLNIAFLIFATYTFGYDRLVNYYNKQCWDGSLSGNAIAVMDSCELAVKLAPNHGAIRDSRGLARALTGDCEGAIEDFTFAVEWFKANGHEADSLEREKWIATLEYNQFISSGEICWQ